MAEIKLAFLPEFEDAMLSRRKTATTRRRQHGQIGSTFRAFGCRFKVVEIHQTDLFKAARDCHAAEGFATPGDFCAAWSRCGKRWTPANRVYVHYFKRVEDNGA